MEKFRQSLKSKSEETTRNIKKTVNLNSLGTNTGRVYPISAIAFPRWKLLKLNSVEQA